LASTSATGWQKASGSLSRTKHFEIFLQAHNGLDQQLGMIKRIGEKVKRIGGKVQTTQEETSLMAQPVALIASILHMETGTLSQEKEVARNPSCIVITAVLRVRK
jgi:hypothetical protein